MNELGNTPKILDTAGEGFVVGDVIHDDFPQLDLLGVLSD